MNKKEIKKNLSHYEKKKFPFTRKYFAEEHVLDRENNHIEFKDVSILECFGLPVGKKIREKINKIEEFDEDNLPIVTGFGREGKSSG